MIKLVVFDLDGTLLNSINDIAASCNYALKTLGYPQRSVEEIETFVGNAVYKLLERALPDNIEKTDAKVEELLKVYREHYSKNQLNTTRPYDSIEQLVDRLKQDGVKLAVFSNKTHSSTVEIINTIFPDKMDMVIGRREGYPVKPDPTSLNEIIKDMGVTAEQTAYVGDSGVDMQVGKNANAHTFGVSWGFQSVDVLKSSGADKIVDSAAQLYDEISNL